jgi:hypothetical protein
MRNFYAWLENVGQEEAGIDTATVQKLCQELVELLGPLQKGKNVEQFREKINQLAKIYNDAGNYSKAQYIEIIGSDLKWIKEAKRFLTAGAKSGYLRHSGIHKHKPFTGKVYSLLEGIFDFTTIFGNVPSEFSNHSFSVDILSPVNQEILDICARKHMGVDLY